LEVGSPPYLSALAETTPARNNDRPSTGNSQTLERASATEKLVGSLRQLANDVKEAAVCRIIHTLVRKDSSRI
jgi:hypothetical protein